MTPFSFRIHPADPARGADYQALITQVLAEFGLAAEPQGVDADVLDIEAAYRAGGGEFWAVWCGDALVGTGGFVVTAPGRADIRKMYLTKAARGFGVGQALLNCIESAARERGVSHLTLETASVLHAAIRLYERNGFQACCGQPSAARCDRHYQKHLERGHD